MYICIFVYFCIYFPRYLLHWDAIKLCQVAHYAGQGRLDACWVITSDRSYTNKDLYLNQEDPVQTTQRRLPGQHLEKYKHNKGQDQCHNHNSNEINVKISLYSLTPYIKIDICRMYFWLWRSREPYKSLGQYSCSSSLCETILKLPRLVDTKNAVLRLVTMFPIL